MRALKFYLVTWVLRQWPVHLEAALVCQMTFLGLSGRTLRGLVFFMFFILNFFDVLDVHRAPTPDSTPIRLPPLPLKNHVHTLLESEWPFPSLPPRQLLFPSPTIPKFSPFLISQSVAL